MGGVSCCRCFEGIGEGEVLEGRDVEDFEEELRKSRSDFDFVFRNFML